MYLSELVCLFIYGCAGSLLARVGFLKLQSRGPSSCVWGPLSGCVWRLPSGCVWGPLSSCRVVASLAVEHGL